MLNSTRTACILGELCIVALALAAPVHAQQMYVDDKLVLNVYSEANQAGEKVATIETGDQVEVLERVENAAHVRLADGREGWVGAGYLTADAPAMVRLKELQAAAPSPDKEAAQKKLTEEVARLKKQNADLLAETDKLKRAAASASAPPPPAPAAEPPRAEPEPTPTPTPVPRSDGLPWLWPVVTVVVAAAAFLFGYQTLARRIRRKYGRVNII